LAIASLPLRSAFAEREDNCCRRKKIEEKKGKLEAC